MRLPSLLDSVELANYIIDFLHLCMLSPSPFTAISKADNSLYNAVVVTS